MNQLCNNVFACKADIKQSKRDSHFGNGHSEYSLLYIGKRKLITAVIETPNGKNPERKESCCYLISRYSAIFAWESMIGSMVPLLLLIITASPGPWPLVKESA